MKRLLCGTIALLWATGLVSAQVVINEFAYDDTGTDDVEFVELYNAGSTAVDISGWTLQSGDQLTGDNNADYTIPSGTVLQPGDYYVIGSGNVPNVDLVVGANNLFENDNEWTVLRDANGNVVDAIAYETNKAPDLTTWVPADVIPQLGPGVWGNYITLQVSATTDDTLLSIGRWRDGYDTNNNGNDFGHMPWTPGAANNPNVFSGSMVMNFDSLNVYDFVPNLSGSFRAPRAIDPTQGDPSYATTPNPNSIPASPQGGNAMIVWDWAGGGNMATSTAIFDGRAGYELYIYIDTALPVPGQLESWMIGVLGTCDSFYNIPYRSLVNAGGMTGIGWYFRRANTTTADPTEVKLRLLNAGTGGDSNPNGNNTWQNYGEIDLSGLSSGWYRLRLEVRGNRIIGVFGGTYGSLSDGTLITATATPNQYGSFYIGYREVFTDDSSTNPVRIDALRLFVPIEGDVDGNGCVDDADLLATLFAFGGTDPLADVNGDGTVDDADLLTVLFNFGTGC
ncbi:Lamin Tail Domain [Armatimonadetes bacterium GBS]|jgi:hypothetical protein|nr:MAG: hypothetical protein KatS3mg021_1767 [Fimbriimonadales bacterium]CUU05557.1 Lamin Tail Domain [Armatimonadetes bacterium GBS]CUU36168.1 Lamin Tail Domain [Armatimonadetes bacterium GXS]